MARDASAAWPEDALEVGRVGEAWGLKGAFRVVAYAEPPLALLAARRWHLRPGDEPRPASAPAVPPTLEIAGVRARGGDGLVASSPAVTDRTAAEALRGARHLRRPLGIPRARGRRVLLGRPDRHGVVNRAGLVLGEVAGLLDNGAAKRPARPIVAAMPASC